MAMSGAAGLLNDANFSNRNVTNISQISILTNLRSLNLSFNKITKLAALLPLHSLSVLNLMHNDITDIQPLANLTSLTILRLSHNKFKELSPLTALSALEELWVQAIPGMTLGLALAALKPLPVLHRCMHVLQPQTRYNSPRTKPRMFADFLAGSSSSPTPLLCHKSSTMRIPLCSYHPCQSCRCSTV
jgi:hypothetical protein